MKRYVEEIRFGETKPSSSKPASKARCKPERGGGERKADVSDPRKYRGVRQRQTVGILRGGDKGFFDTHSDLVRDFRYGGGIEPRFDSKVTTL